MVALRYRNLMNRFVAALGNHPRHLTAVIVVFMAAVGWLWLIVENAGPQLMHGLTAFLPEGGFKAHLIASAAHMRLLTMGVILLLVLRFSPRGLLPEK